MPPQFFSDSLIGHQILNNFLDTNDVDPAAEREYRGRTSVFVGQDTDLFILLKGLISEDSNVFMLIP